MIDEEYIKRHLFECKDLGPEPEFNKHPFWPESKEKTARKLRELMDEFKNQQTE